eukprot:UN13723
MINSMLYCTVLNTYQIINTHACILAAFCLDIYTHLDPIQTDRKIIGKELYSKKVDRYMFCEDIIYFIGSQRSYLKAMK